jgi:arabinan endo-1,5-alpha-L-arabinosidase
MPNVASAVFALDGQIGIHDPSTVVRCNGRLYTYGTGGSSLVSDDGWTWKRGAALPRRGLAPDVIHISDRYYVYIAANIGAQPKAAINMVWNKTLDPDSPITNGKKAAWSPRLTVSKTAMPSIPASSLIPTTAGCGSSMGLTSVTSGWFSSIPKPASASTRTTIPDDLAINCEASDMIYHDGWYYLLATHGSCCRGADSGYNICVGRARKVTGPFLDNMGVDMIQGGGKLFVGSGGRVVGPGHFGLLDLGEGVQKFSTHYEAYLDRGGASVLDMRPLLWKDGWPVAGENLKEGTFEIESVSTGTALELAVEGMPVGGRRARRGPGPGATPGGAGPGGMFAGQGGVIPPQDVAEVSKNWPAGNVDARMANYMCQAQQKWAIAAVPNAGGYPGSPYFKITVAGTDRALAATEEAEISVLSAFTGGPEQLWRMDQLADGTWRISPKSIPNSREALVLTAAGSSFARSP